ncbi:MAG: glycosyltransferase 87 family protein, partial [Syntrophothermus sp.]
LHILILGFAYRQTYLNTRDLITKFFYRTTVISEQWILILAVVGSMIFFVKEVYLGNINIILIWLALLALKYLIEGKNRRFGMVFTLVILTKPFFGLLILPLIFRKDIPAMLYILFGIIAGLLIPSVFYGFEKNLILISDWINTMVIHDSSFPSVNSIDYLTHRYFFPNLSAYFEMVILLAFIAAFFLCKWIQVRKIDFSQLADTQSLVIEWFIILALIPNLFKMDTEHFLASIPLITFLVYFIAVNRKYLLIPLMVVLIFFFGGNSQDLLGKEFSGFLFQLGLIGISNLLMVLMLLILYIRKSGS